MHICIISVEAGLAGGLYNFHHNLKYLPVVSSPGPRALLGFSSLIACASCSVYKLVPCLGTIKTSSWFLGGGKDQCM